MKNKQQDPTESEPFAPPQPTATSTRITPLEIQQKEFRYARFGGYKMRDVDEFLDRVTESMSAVQAENDRLRSGGAGDAPVLGTSDLDDVNRQADEIIQRARDEASRILADARSRSGAIAGTAAVAGAVTDEDRAAISAFLSREKEFLQRLAGIVQEHAGEVKEMARSARTAPPATAPSEAPKAPAPSAPSPVQPATAATPAATPEPAPAAEKAEATISLPRAEEPVRTEQPATAGVRRDGGDDPAGGGGDGSLRELFWGEE